MAKVIDALRTHTCQDERPEFMDGTFAWIDKPVVYQNDVVKCSCGRYYLCTDATFYHYTELSRRQVLALYRRARKNRMERR